MARFQEIVCLIFCTSLTTLSVATSVEMPPAGTVVQYCDFETFKARCAARHEVIVMKEASYGRQETGRCLPTDSVIESFRHDPRYFGCSANVLHLADRKCSGLSRCDIAIPDPDFERITPCYKDSRKYLEAKYDCVRVVEADRSCVVEVSTSAVHISSRQQWKTSTDDSCGSVSQPWTLRAPTGQHIRVHLLDFAADDVSQHTEDAARRNDDDGDEGMCREYGHVDEMVTSAAATRRRQTVICGNQRRNQLITESNSHVIHVVFNQPLTNSTDVNFLLRFDAVGCLDVRPPADAWMRRIGSDVVEIGCYMSRQVWVLRCVDNQFVGVIGNCTQHLKDHSEERMEDVQNRPKSVEMSSGVQVLSLVAVSVAGLAVCLTVICVGLLCLRRQKRNGSSDKTSAKYQRHFTEEDYTPVNKFNTAASTDYNERTAAAAATRLHPAASHQHV